MKEAHCNHFEQLRDLLSEANEAGGVEYDQEELNAQAEYLWQHSADLLLILFHDQKEALYAGGMMAVASLQDQGN